MRLPWSVYQNDASWVPPLLSQATRSLDPSGNPFFRHADVMLLLVRRGRVVVGTAAAFYDRWLADHEEQEVGCLGFLEVLEDYSAAACLLDAAVERLRGKGASA